METQRRFRPLPLMRLQRSRKSRWAMPIDHELSMIRVAKRQSRLESSVETFEQIGGECGGSTDDGNI
jgi:hypothetical protein